jgi:hypothetical protein
MLENNIYILGQIELMVRIGKGKRTSEHNDRKRSKYKVIKQNESVLIQIGCLETGEKHQSVSQSRVPPQMHLLKGRNQNMANV